MNRFVAVFVLTALASPAAAQQKSVPDPTNPGVPVPSVKYESLFTGYVPYREQDVGAWRDLNEDVARAGGHVGIFGGAGHAGHAKPATKLPPATATPASKPAPKTSHGADHK